MFNQLLAGSEFGITLLNRLMVILLGMETLPVLGFLFSGRRSQAGKVHVEHSRCSDGKTNGKRLVTWVVELGMP